MTEFEQPQSSAQPDKQVQDLSRSYAAFLSETTPEESGLEGGQTASEVDSRAAAAPPPLMHILESLLFVGGGPLTTDRATAAIRGLTSEQLSEAIDALNRQYRSQGRPYAIENQGQGYALTMRSRFKPVIERLYGQVRATRLSSTAIDVLSLVAYRQPVTKKEIDGIRGAESGGLLRQLIRRGLVAIARRAEANHRDVTYCTTARFLDFFKLASLDDLPQTQDLQRL
jgi:segregation and condensation protein B